jgi:multidrug efflux pump subunit AcrB
MWIVRLALRNPYSIAVLALVLMIMGALSTFSMLTDIFPVIDIPVVGVIWNYPGLTAEEMERRVVTINERAFSTTVQGISRIESQSIPSVGNIRVYFQPGTDIGSATAQIAAVCQTILRIMPPGITPPNVLPFNAANVPVAQLTISSETLPEQSLFDYALNFVRIRLFTIPGLATPAPYGGATRQINVDVDPQLAAAKGISPQDVSASLQTSNIILPAGIARIGKVEYNVLTNASPLKVTEFSSFPIKVVNGREVLMGDVAHVADAQADQTNAVRINGKRAIYLAILKKANASTLDVVNSVKKLIPSLAQEAPEGMHFKLDFDQSTFVRGSIVSVLSEAVTASILVSIMILLFLRSWRSILIVCSSIPLSVFFSLIGLKLTEQTINTMTLGGLALSIGMLVDDATVEVENINRNRPISPNITVAILKGAHQIALPAIVTTLAICIVFFPVVLLTGPAKFLFTPLAEAVVLAMIASYLLSRTLVPVMAHWLLRGTPHEEEHEGLFEKLKHRYALLLAVLLRHPRLTLVAAILFMAISFTLPVFVVGQDFFPTVDAGLMRIHFRGPPGSRLEETEKIIAQFEDRLRKLIPEKDLETINVNIGVPTFYNLSFVPTDNAASMDAEVLIALKEGHAPTSEYKEKIRRDFAKNFPDSAIYFQAADIVSQVLNFGLTAPLDIQIESRDVMSAFRYAKDLRDKLELIPGAKDVVIKQILDYPSLKINVDRQRAAQLGLSERDVSSSVLVSLSSSSLVSPSYYLNPENGVNYSVVVKVPIKQVESVPELMSVPITPAGANPLVQQAGVVVSSNPTAPTQTIGNLVSVESLNTLNQVNHVDVQRILDVTANVEGRDLGSMVKAVRKAISSLGELPKGMRIRLRGQNEVMEESFTKLGLGMILAGVLVYLLMVTLFQSWLDPLIIMIAVPGSFCGVLWILALTGTTINVESLMGSIMAIGIAVSNSNLMVNFANDFRISKENTSASRAALEAGEVRLRPILMTALAMILGMMPMAFGFSESGSQNVPLAIAVIGGLIFSTIATLFVVPVAYAFLRVKMPTKHELRAQYHRDEAIYDAEMAEEAKRGHTTF